MSQALQRLFLIILPLSLFCLALFLTNKKNPLSQKNKPPSKSSTPHIREKSFSSQKNKLSADNSASAVSGKPKTQKNKPPAENPALFRSACPFYYGFSFFPLIEKKQNIFKNTRSPSPPFTTYLLSRQNFLQKVRNLKKELKKHNISLEKALFALPLALTKDKKWLISKKPYFILPTGEKKEISHLNSLQVKKQHEELIPHKGRALLSLSEALSHLPDAHFLFLIEESHRENLIKNLKIPLPENWKGDIFLSSSNEKLLAELSEQTPWQILHSFKGLTRFQMMRIFHLDSWKTLTGRGFVIPPFFFLSLKDLEFLKKQKKILFFKKDPPFDSSDQLLIQNSNALISSEPKQALSIIKKKKPCFIGK